MKIRDDETQITGHWLFDGKSVLGDDNCNRIDLLRASYLKYISADKSGWRKLYQDPEDGRYWQLNFEHGEMQGGGPPSLLCLSELEIKELYNL
jgi:hypothetical protein